MSEQHSEWKPCPEGEVRQLVGRLQRRRQRNAARRGAGIVALVALVAFGTVMTARWDRAALRELTCREVVALAPEFVAGRLDPSTEASVHQHLADCGSCRRHLEDLRHDPARAAINARDEPAVSTPDRRRPPGTVIHLAASHR